MYAYNLQQQSTYLVRQTNVTMEIRQAECNKCISFLDATMRKVTLLCHTSVSCFQLCLNTSTLPVTVLLLVLLRYFFC